MTASTWETRERPILEAVLAMEESERPARADNAAVAEATGLAPHVVSRSLGALVESGYLAGGDAGGLTDSSARYFSLRLLERGRREVGQWPPTVADAFLARLDHMIANADDTEERTRLRRLRNAVGDVSKGVISGAIVAAGTAQF